MPRPAWIRIGTRRSSASAKSSLDRRLGEGEALGPRMKLDPAGAGVEAARRLGHRAGVRVDAAVRDQHASDSAAAASDEVVGRPVAVGLVHREDDGAGAARGSRPASSSAGVCL